MSSPESPILELSFRYSSVDQVLYLKISTTVSLTENEILTLKNYPVLGSAMLLHYEVETAESVTGTYVNELPLFYNVTVSGTDTEKKDQLKAKIETDLTNKGIKFYVVTVGVYRPLTSTAVHSTETISSNATIEID
jgi:hypothetical protein